jgi:hypothetical protein
MHTAVGPCAKGHFIHAGTNGPGVPLLLLDFYYDFNFDFDFGIDASLVHVEVFLPLLLLIEYPLCETFLFNIKTIFYFLVCLILQN